MQVAHSTHRKLILIRSEYREVQYVGGIDSFFREYYEHGDARPSIASLLLRRRSLSRPRWEIMTIKAYIEVVRDMSRRGVPESSIYKASRELEVLKDQPSWNSATKSFDSTKLQDLLKYTVDVGVEVTPPLTFKVKKSNHENSNLYKLAKEFGFLPADMRKEGILGSKLVGRSARVKIVHSKPSAINGSVFDNVDISSIEALDTNTVEDDASNPNIV